MNHVMILYSAYRHRRVAFIEVGRDPKEVGIVVICVTVGMGEANLGGIRCIVLFPDKHIHVAVITG